MAIDTSTMTNLINSEYITTMIAKYQTQKQLDAIFADGAMGNDVNLTDAENILKAPTAVVTSFDGKAKKVVVPVMGRATGSVTALGETSNDPTEITYNVSTAEVTITEYGKQKATISGKAQLQVFDGAVAQVLAYMASCAADSKEKLIASKITAASKTNWAEEKSQYVSESDKDEVKYIMSNPTGTPKKPAAGFYYLDGSGNKVDMIEIALANIANSERFDNGLFMGIIHHEAVPALRASGAVFESFQLHQAGSPVPANNIAYGVLGAFKGVMWFATDNPYFKVSAGGAEGQDAFKTLIFGKNFIAKAFVDPEYLPRTPDVEQFVFDDFVIRVAPDGADPHRRNKIVTWYFVGGYNIADRDNGIAIYHIGDPNMKLAG